VTSPLTSTSTCAALSSRRIRRRSWSRQAHVSGSERPHPGLPFAPDAHRRAGLAATCALLLSSGKSECPNLNLSNPTTPRLVPCPHAAWMPAPRNPVWCQGSMGHPTMDAVSPPITPAHQNFLLLGVHRARRPIPPPPCATCNRPPQGCWQTSSSRAMAPAASPAARGPTSASLATA
jgi:hypothetical protein